jgi:hypothetical protein
MQRLLGVNKVALNDLAKRGIVRCEQAAVARGDVSSLFRTARTVFALIILVVLIVVLAVAEALIILRVAEAFVILVAAEAVAGIALAPTVVEALVRWGVQPHGPHCVR